MLWPYLESCQPAHLLQGAEWVLLQCCPLHVGTVTEHSDCAQSLWDWAQWQVCGASDWVIGTVTRGYRPQFASSPPCFNGIVLSQTHGEKALVLKEEIATFQSKGPIWVVPPEQSRFLFIYISIFSIPEGMGDVLGCMGCHGNDSSEEICDDGCLRKDNSKWHMKSGDAVYTHKLPGTPGGLAGADTYLAFPESATCFGQNRQHHCSGILVATCCCWELTHVRHIEPGGRRTVQRQPSLQGLKSQQWDADSEMGHWDGRAEIDLFALEEPAQRPGNWCSGTLVATYPSVMLFPTDHSYSCFGWESEVSRWYW